MCQDVLVTPSASVCWLALFPSIGEENIALDFQTPISAAAITDTQFHAQVQKQFICHSYVYAPLSWLKLRNKLLLDKSVFQTVSSFALGKKHVTNKYCKNNEFKKVLVKNGNVMNETRSFLKINRC